MKEIVFVTGNTGKIASAEKYFLDYDVKFSCVDFGVDEPEVNDIEYISKYKVVEAYKRLKKPCIALDAGFYIVNYPSNPLFPGAFPKRELIDKIGVDGLLENMKGVKDRSCYFKECLSYYDGKEIKCFYGYTYGSLSEQILGDDTDKKWSDLWYVFIPKGYNKTLAQMTDEERNNRKGDHTVALKEFAKWFIENNL